MTDPAAEMDHYYETHEHPDPAPTVTPRERRAAAGSEESALMHNLVTEARIWGSMAEARLMRARKTLANMSAVEEPSATALYAQMLLQRVCKALETEVHSWERLGRAAAEGAPEWYDPDSDVPF